MTREEAIKRLETHIAYHQCGAWPFTKTDEAMEMAISALREQDSNANQHVSNTSNALGGWISVEERLPEPNVLVLVVFKRHDEIRRRGFGTLQQHGAWYVSNEGMPPVTHWIPLPEPPKEEV